MTLVWIMILGGLGLAFGLNGFLIGCFLGILLARFVEARCQTIRNSPAYKRAKAREAFAASLDADKHYAKGFDADAALLNEPAGQAQLKNVFASAALHHPVEGFATVEAEARKPVKRGDENNSQQSRSRSR